MGAEGEEEEAAATTSTALIVAAIGSRSRDRSSNSRNLWQVATDVEDDERVEEERFLINIPLLHRMAHLAASPATTIEPIIFEEFPSFGYWVLLHGYVATLGSTQRFCAIAHMWNV